MVGFEGSGRIGIVRHLALAFVAAVLAHQGSQGTAWAAAGGLVSGIYQINWDQTVDTVDGETTDVRKFKHTLELKYKGFLSPVVMNEVTFKIEQEMNSNAEDITRVLPQAEIGFKGAYWDAKGGAKRTDESSDDPTSPPKTTDNYFGEFYYKAPKRVPDFKAKYTLDTDFQEGTTDTAKQGVTLSSIYAPKQWFEVKGEYVRNKSDDRLTPDTDTEDEKATGQALLRHMVSEKIKVEVQGYTEISRAATLQSDNGAALPDTAKEDQTHRVQSLISFRPFDTTTLDGGYDFELKQNKANGEHTITQNYKGMLTQQMGRPYDLTLTFNRNTVEAKHTADDYLKTEDTITVDGKVKLTPLMMLVLKYQKKDTDEEHLDPAKSKTSGTVLKSGSWSGKFANYCVGSASFDQTDTITNEVKTNIDTKYSLKATFDFAAVNILLDPSYDITLKKDLLLPDSSAIRDFKFKLSWKTRPTMNTEAKVEHTYGRKADSGAKNIERTDNSTGNLTWLFPFPGWTFSFDVARTATDKSGDDLPPDITSTYGVKADYKYQWLALSTAVTYDKKSLADEAGTLDAKAAWTAENWDASLTYTFKKTFSEAVNESYAISLTFKYNL